MKHGARGASTGGEASRGDGRGRIGRGGGGGMDEEGPGEVGGMGEKGPGGGELDYALSSH